MTRPFKRLIGSATLVCALAAPAPAGAACAAADAPAGTVTARVTRAAVRCLTNAARAAHGLPELRPSARLDRAAQAHTAAMVGTGLFQHRLSPGRSLGDRVRSTGYDWRTVAENIATGYETPRRVVAVWLRSVHHCRAIFAPVLSHIGIGVAASTPFDTAGATFTQEIARQRGSAAPSSDAGPQARCPHELDSDADGVTDFVRSRFRELDPCPDIAGQACAGRALVFWVKRLGDRRLSVSGVVVGDHPVPIVGIRVMRRQGQLVRLAPLASTGRFAIQLRIPRGGGMTRLRLRAHSGGQTLIEHLTLR
jgi:cysteine-rich secretory family protein